MAGSALTVTVNGNPYLDGHRDRAQIICDWTSDASAGTVAIAIASTYTAAQIAYGGMRPNPKRITGNIRLVETIPGLLGDKTTTCPTDNYDITLPDAYGFDVMEGGLANRSSSVAQIVSFEAAPLPIDSDLTLTIANAGNSKTGRVIITVDPMDA